MTDHGIRRTTLDSGLRVVTERLPGLRSAAVGFWVGTGSRDEPAPIAGASHFLEHLLFKGTDTRTRSEIAEAVESVGGDMNAFTGQEVTAFYVRVPDRHLALALDILSDIVWTPALRADEVESERQVILEEIRMRDDTPDDLVHEAFAGALFPEHPLGREIAGTHRDHHRDVARRDRRVPPRALPAVEHRGRGGRATCTTTTWSRWSSARCRRDAVHRSPRARQRRRAGAPEPVRASSSVRSSRPTSCSACVSLRRDDADRFALAVLDQVLGGGMSSRLFQEVRERRGLAYSVFSYRSAFEDTGTFAVYSGTAPERVEEVLDVVARRARPPRRRRRDHRPRARGREGPPHRVDGARRSRARRAGCTASAAPSSRSARCPTSTRWSRRSSASPPTTSRASIDRVLGTGGAHAGGGRARDRLGRRPHAAGLRRHR